MTKSKAETIELMEYKEIFRLKEMLEKAKIPFVFRNLYDGYQICYPRNDNLKEGIFGDDIIF